MKTDPGSSEIKLDPGLGLGYWLRLEHEIILIARRDDFPLPSPHLRPPSVFFAPRREHSIKPDAPYAAIERMYPDLPKIELFARARRPGWDAWGNELPPDIDKADVAAVSTRAISSTSRLRCAGPRHDRRTAHPEPA